MKRNQLNGLPYLDLSTIDHIEDKQENEKKSVSNPLVYKKEVSQENLFENLPQGEEIIIGNFFSLLMTRDQFEFSIISDSGSINNISADNDYHAILIKNDETASWINSIKLEVNPSLNDLTKIESKDDSSWILAAVKQKFDTDHTNNIVMIDKQEISVTSFERAQTFTTRLCEKLGLSRRDAILITAAGDIHNLSKRHHLSHNNSFFKILAETNANTLKFLNKNSPILKILMSLYNRVVEPEETKPTLERFGGNILTVIDLFFDTFIYNDDNDRPNINGFKKQLNLYSGRLFYQNVVDGFIEILEEEYPDHSKPKKFDTVFLHTDTKDKIYSFTNRFKNEGFKLMIDNNREAFVEQCLKRPPDFIVIRLQSLPRDIIQNLQYFSSKGINFSKIPTFLLVRETIINRLSSLLDIGIQDIFAIDGKLDMLISKIKKLKYQLEQSQLDAAESNKQQMTSRGNLRDMNLIDLIQALGPAKRTTRITIKHEEDSEEKLTVYLNKGNIIFASLAELRGPDAIYKAICWEDGFWVMEPLADDELPQSSIDLSNEAILMEGCRLLDESKKTATT